ncbi:unnamed protein product [Spirodela intermedia]|uniref:Alpha/beta hydrolase fold-3 domain-containing protein n=1 Tax=Spirodela intermedia TaxID=51605 RepID=A0A7I8IJU3_SPIIN|nr:unnamed protein product [Spirodela intermedia]CAA6658157.1 unnamed protein product [Spirodela intermedia]
MTMHGDGSGGEVAENFAQLFYVYQDGRVERLMGTAVVPPSVDSATGVASKDVPIVSATGVSARLYLPPPPLASSAAGEKLPIVVYFHGGAFFVEFAASPTYHQYLNSLAAAARVLCVSVEYRRAPEHPLPAAYDDSWAALSWVAAHAGGAAAASPPEPWLSEYGDFTRVFLAGDSCGGNIAHNMAMRAAVETLSSGLKIEGLVAVHPYFWFRPASRPSIAGPAEALTAWIERLWRLSYPSAARGLEEPCMNPAVPGLRAWRHWPAGGCWSAWPRKTSWWSRAPATWRRCRRADSQGGGALPLLRRGAHFPPHQARNCRRWGDDGPPRGFPPWNVELSLTVLSVSSVVFLLSSSLRPLLLLPPSPELSPAASIAGDLAHVTADFCGRWTTR